MKFDFIRIMTQNEIKIFDKICYLYVYREFFPFVKNDNVSIKSISVKVRFYETFVKGYVAEDQSSN